MINIMRTDYLRLLIGRWTNTVSLAEFAIFDNDQEPREIGITEVSIEEDSFSKERILTIKYTL